MLVSIFSIDMNAQGRNVAEIRNGETTLTTDVNQLKADWAESLAENSDLRLSFDQLSIKVEKSNYFLIGQDARNGAKSMLQLTQNGSTLSIKDGTTTVTCAGCTSPAPGECEPIKLDRGYSCGGCSTSECTKTVETVFTH